MRRRKSGLTGAAVAALLSPLLLAGAAQAHSALAQRPDLPIPEYLFNYGAAVVLIVSFFALAVLWPRPRLEQTTDWRPLPGGAGGFLASRGVDAVCQVIGALVLVLVMATAFLGVDNANDNFAPTFVMVIVWVGIAFASALFGDVFRPFNPWRAFGRAGGWVVSRAGGAGVVERIRRPYPERLGRWPAALGLLGFTWFELVQLGGSHPRQLGVAVLVYSLLTFAGMARYGAEPWIRNGEAFSVYLNLFARLSPFETRGPDDEPRTHGKHRPEPPARRTVGLRPPLSGLTRLDALPGTVAVIAVMIGTVTFDGFSQNRYWDSVETELIKLLTDVGLSVADGEVVARTLGLLAGVGLVAGFYWLGIEGARSVGGNLAAGRLRIGFVHSLVPIAVVYAVAHYLTYLIFSGQPLFYLASDPFGEGWDLFGTAATQINYGVISQNLTWYLQVGFVVLGHVAALVLAHDRALVLYGQAKLAVRSQYWMLAVMVGFTTLALWLLAQANVE